MSNPEPSGRRRRGTPADASVTKRPGWLVDLDGTLIDSSEGVIRAFHKAQVTFGEKPAEPSAIRARIGYPLHETVAALSGVAVTDFVPVFRGEALASMHLYSRVLPGAVDFLAWLAARNRRAAVVTSKRRDVALQVLKHLGLADCFREVVGSDCTPEVKPHPAPVLLAARRLSLDLSQVVMVGDTQNDVRAARSAGVPVIALASGHDARSLLTGADLLFDDLPALLSHLKSCEERS